MLYAVVVFLRYGTFLAGQMGRQVGQEVNWRSYIRSLDKIMDLTEVSMKWLDGSNASLVILRDVNE